MTYNTNLPLRVDDAVVRVADGGTAGWLVPPIRVPALLAIMIGMRAAFLSYRW